MAAKEKRKKKLTIEETYDLMAQTGDVEGLWQTLLDTKWDLLDRADVFKLLFRALEVAAHGNPSQYSEALFARMVSFSTYLMLRGQFYMQTLIAQNDHSSRSRGTLSLPTEVKDMLPAFLELQQSVAAMAESQARTAQLWAMAGKGRRNAKPPEEAMDAEKGGVEGKEPLKSSAPPVAPKDESSKRRRAAPSNDQNALEAGKESDNGNGTAGGSLPGPRPAGGHPGGVSPERTAPDPPRDDCFQDGCRPEKVGASFRRHGRWPEHTSERLSML